MLSRGLTAPLDQIDPCASDVWLERHRRMATERIVVDST